MIDSLEHWPDSDVEYAYPSRTLVNESRWREGILSGLALGSIEIQPRVEADDLYELIGTCPRCGHEMTQTLEFDVILGAVPVSGISGKFNIFCNCRSPHKTRSEGRYGCGWGGANEVKISVGR